MRGLPCGYLLPLVEVGGPLGPTLETKAMRGLRWIRFVWTSSNSHMSETPGGVRSACRVSRM
jgi:hypothetical protein